MKRTQRKPEEMFPVIEAYLKSGTTQKSFCAEYGIAISIFGYWLRRYRHERAASGGFIEVAPAGATDRPLVEVTYPSGVRLRIFSPVEPGYLERLLEV